jgi:hypothetical protein
MTDLAFNSWHFVFLKDTICREQGHLFRKRLGNEHLVKRVSVMIRQPPANARG